MSRKHRVLTFAGTVLLCCAPPSFCQENPIKGSPVKGTAELAFATGALKNSPPASQASQSYWDLRGISRRGYGFEFKGGALFYRLLTLGGNVGLLLHRDKYGSTVATTGGVKGTSVTSSYFSLYAGGRTPPLALSKEKPWYFTAGGDVGRSWAGSLKKSVGNCTNCGESTVNLVGGYYVEPSVKFYNASGLGFGFGYRIYSGKADFRNMLLVKVSWN